MEDILQPKFYEPSDAADLKHLLAKAGLFNVGQLIQHLFERVAELESEVEELEDRYDYEYEFREAEADLDKIREGRNTFALYFNSEFERNCVKYKTIGGTTFAIIKDEDLEELKSRFHSELD